MKKKIRFQFDNKLYTVNIEQIGNELIIENEGAIYHVSLIPESREKTRRQVPTRADLNVSLTPTEAKVHGETKEEGHLLSPMTGVVEDVKVKEGSRVEKGQVVIVVEAMKMYVDVHAHRSGIVEEIYVKKGETVSLNQPLLMIK